VSDSATLIVGPSWVGDMVMAQSLFLYLKDREPARSLDVLAPGWSLPVVARMPQIREGIAAETGHGELGLGKRRRIGYALRGKYDRAIILPRSLKSALIPWFADINTRTGFRGESRYLLINDVRTFDKQVLDQTVKRFLALGLTSDSALPPIPSPALQVSSENQRSVMTSLKLETGRPVVALMPGAEYGPAKCWPHEKFAELAELVAADGYDVWVLGSEKDVAAGQVIANSSSAKNLCGKTSLEDVIDLLGYAQHAVSNDSGLMHIAAAAGVITHAIYGSSSPDFTPPLTDRRHIHYLNLDCSPCFKRECPLGHLNCLNNLDAGRIHAAIGRAAIS
jgi:heptosyltransferase-2